MKSNWENSKIKSKYHFDNFKIDPNYDTVIKLGQIKGDWSSELKEIVDTSKPATWATRGYKGEGVMPPREDLLAEEYDLEQTGYGKDYVVTHINWKISPTLQKISDLFGLKDCMNRVHVQMPGEVWNLHLDKLEKWNPEQPYTIKRIMVQLTDWQMGHFWSYGNYNYTGWKAGDVTTFDWMNVPHSTANAGHTPRVTFQMTGVATEQTNEFLARLKRFDTYALELKESSW
jgi:hypothetical protein